MSLTTLEEVHVMVGTTAWARALVESRDSGCGGEGEGDTVSWHTVGRGGTTPIQEGGSRPGSLGRRPVLM